MPVDKSITLPFRPKSEALTTKQFVKTGGGGDATDAFRCNFLLVTMLGIAEVLLVKYRIESWLHYDKIGKLLLGLKVHPPLRSM